MSDSARIAIQDPDVIGVLEGAERVWVVAAIHGRAEAIRGLHVLLRPKLQDRDRLVYTGNYLGRGTPEGIRATMDELVRFRRKFLIRRGAEAHDVQYLRGAQEEMWSKLLQLQLASDPAAVMDWMMRHGVAETLEAYGAKLHQVQAWCREGVVQLTRWTGSLRQTMQKNPGHFELFKSLKRAVRTADGRLLFVHANIDPTRPLEMQGDSFWWDTGGFSRIDGPLFGFARVIRGYCHKDHGIDVSNPFAATVDGGCGMSAALSGGTLNAVCFGPDGGIVDLLYVNEQGEAPAAVTDTAPTRKPKPEKPKPAEKPQSAEKPQPYTPDLFDL